MAAEALGPPAPVAPPLRLDRGGTREVFRAKTLCQLGEAETCDFGWGLACRVVLGCTPKPPLAQNGTEPRTAHSHLGLDPKVPSDPYREPFVISGGRPNLIRVLYIFVLGLFVQATGSSLAGDK